MTVTESDAISLTFSSEPDAVDEGATDTFSFQLASEPTASVSFDVTTTFDTVEPATLEFGTSDYLVEQDVTISGLSASDTTATFGLTLANEPNGNIAVRVTSIHSLNRSDLTFTPDNWDTLQAITISGFGNALEATAHVRLTATPPAEVTIGVSSQNTNVATVSPASRVFTSSNWDTDQDITVTGISNNDLGQDTSSIRFQGAGADYDDLDYSSVVTVTNVETASLVFTQTAQLVAVDATGVWSVRLAHEPTGNVLLSGTSSNTDVFTSSPIGLGHTLTENQTHPTPVSYTHLTLPTTPYV